VLRTARIAPTGNLAFSSLSRAAQGGKGEVASGRDTRSA